MKRAIVVLLVLAMAFSLFACGDGGNDSTTSGDSNTPSGTAGNTSTPPDIAPPVSIDEGFEFPYIDFEYYSDPHSRDTYKLAYLTPFYSSASQGMMDSYKLLEGPLNFEISAFDTNSDVDQFMTLVEVCAGQDYDGLIVEGDFTTQDRIFDIMADFNVPYFPGLSPYLDATGHYLMPGVVVDSYSRGVVCMEFLLENYHSHTGTDIPLSEVGVIVVQWSPITDFNERRDGAFDAYNAVNSSLVSTNWFDVDTAPEANPVTAEASYNQVAATVAANPQFKGWIAHGTMEDFADGASRALEDLGFGDTSIVTSDSANTIASRWDAGYDGCWAGGVDSPFIQWAHAQMYALFQLIEGTSTLESLWPNYRAAGQDYTVIKLPYTMVTRDVYIQYRTAVSRYVDLYITN